MTYQFPHLETYIAQAARAIEPRIASSVVQSAIDNRWLITEGGTKVKFDPGITPYTKEVQDEFTNLDHQVVAFAGPSRCGKSYITENAIVHICVNDPGDLCVFHMNEAAALKWSKKELANIFDLCPSVDELIMPGRENRTFSDIRFINSMHIYVKASTISNLSQVTLRYVFFNDLDQIPQNVADRGTPYELGRKRTLIAGRRGLTFAESSPGLPIMDPSWIEPPCAVDAKGNPLDYPSHVAPPCGGILDVFNQGDRRRWYWPCPHCGTFASHRFRDIVAVDSTDDNEVIESAHIVCQTCRDPILQVHKQDMNAAGLWLKEGEGITAKRERHGHPRRSVIASFHLFGPAARFVSWGQLALEHLQAKRNFENTLDDGKLKAFMNTGAGEAYVPPKRDGVRLPEDMAAAAYGGQRYGREDGSEAILLPDDTRFLVATVDPGGHMFDVQVHAICLPSFAKDDTGKDIAPPPRIRVVDRFKIVQSDRLGDPYQAGDQIIRDRLPIKPGEYEEDWRVLIDRVVNRQYDLPDGRRMAIKVMGYDIAGNDEITTNSYQFFRFIRREFNDLVPRIVPCRGERKPNAPRTETRRPEATRKDQVNAAMGDIEVLFDNPNRLKSEIDALISRGQTTADGVMFADYLPKVYPGFFQEMAGEYKKPDDTWHPMSKRQRVESWDLLRMCWALVTHPGRPGIRLNRVGGFPWTGDDTPNWAKDWDHNELVSDPRVRQKPETVAQRTADDIEWEYLGS